MTEIEKLKQRLQDDFLEVYLRLQQINTLLPDHSLGGLVWKGKNKQNAYWQYRLNNKQYQVYVAKKNVESVKNEIEKLRHLSQRKKELEELYLLMRKILTVLGVDYLEVIKHYEEDFFNIRTQEELRQKAEEIARSKKYQQNYKHITDKGDLVASKSEEIIANVLFAHQISYEYEKKIMLGNVELQPDFTLYKADGNIILWEHAGLLDQEGYSKNFERKLQLYTAHGYTQQKNLIVTREENGTFEAEEARRMLRLYGLMK